MRGEWWGLVFWGGAWVLVAATQSFCDFQRRVKGLSSLEFVTIWSDANV